MNTNIGYNRLQKYATFYIVAILILIGSYDALTGLYLILSSTPMQVHGPGTIWSGSNSTSDIEISLYQRIGAYSLHVGIVTIVYGWFTRTHPGFRTVLLVTYFITGMAFAYHDHLWFSGTYYWYLKQFIGFLFFLALVIQIYGLWKGWWQTDTN